MDERKENELAENLDDEKQLYRAERHASCKLKAAAAKNRKFLRKEWRRSKAHIPASSPTPSDAGSESSQPSSPLLACLGIYSNCLRSWTLRLLSMWYDGPLKNSHPLVLSQTMSKQIKETAMGTRMVPSYANIFMGELEKHLLQSTGYKFMH